MKSTLEFLNSVTEQERMTCPKYSCVVFVHPSERHSMLTELMFLFDKEVTPVDLMGSEIKLPKGGHIYVRTLKGGDDYIFMQHAGMQYTTVVFDNTAFYKQGHEFQYRPYVGNVIPYLLTRLRSESKYSSQMIIC